MVDGLVYFYFRNQNSKLFGFRWNPYFSKLSADDCRKTCDSYENIDFQLSFRYLRIGLLALGRLRMSYSCVSENNWSVCFVKIK